MFIAAVSSLAHHVVIKASWDITRIYIRTMSAHSLRKVVPHMCHVMQRLHHHLTRLQIGLIGLMGKVWTSTVSLPKKVTPTFNKLAAHFALKLPFFFNSNPRQC